ncbi:MAG TPA: hypothetical protein EYH07_19960 [Kiloniellaceae bacterium]|nr:hypothetical protein [Kiloniellaceae bacterium]HIP80721.1 hypothetical protein [Kiloniellaceae bacterium]
MIGNKIATALFLFVIEGVFSDFPRDSLGILKRQLSKRMVITSLFAGAKEDSVGILLAGGPPDLSAGAGVNH